MAEDYEIEEGEMYDDSHIGLAYIDVKIQSILGDYMNDFEGGVSIENLGPKFGVYGTFLMSYRLPSPQKSQNLPSPTRFSSHESIRFPVRYQISVIKSLNPTEQTTFKLQTRVRVGSNKTTARTSSDLHTGFDKTHCSELTSWDKPPVSPFIIEGDWIRCRKCRKWRLLPYGTKPEQLSESWLCSMLDWLPGMNYCDISEEDTTRALHASYQSLIQSNLQNRGGKGLIDVKAQDGRKISVKKRKLRTLQCNGNDLGDSDTNAFEREVSGRFRKLKKSKVFQTEKRESSTSKGAGKSSSRGTTTRRRRIE
ncbi:cysteine-tryptophan domain-containing zinc finger protein 7-like [Solanum dulcamara]|uniref:cysteine-tryptophan domain-containing zinc finger protein 7-like n=1 Tax=Solanum dulcamara TaxID=45834 RepID=UPI0024868287|nr:cysteine-tryptophan domain-containing zinc finger protein 7-like [Solanum dulcamara]XP_055820620.1 cysteine-tryptophan domain-containing zinc finger protein 7-like [Solanum dulcamara]XP_055820621.1 cysteine-tryptophan domain-containing zinc finger protein 7-like [Solanum dulcamara]